MKKIGKISNISFGYGGYQDAMIGIAFIFEGPSWGTRHFDGDWSMKRTESCKWTEEDRLKRLGETVMRLNDLLTKAKVSNVSELKGIPVEVTFEGNMFQSFRILEEVL